jgi:hypothetical protein
MVKLKLQLVNQVTNILFHFILFFLFYYILFIYLFSLSSIIARDNDVFIIQSTSAPSVNGIFFLNAFLFDIKTKTKNNDKLKIK